VIFHNDLPPRSSTTPNIPTTSPGTGQRGPGRCWWRPATRGWRSPVSTSVVFGEVERVRSASRASPFASW